MPSSPYRHAEAGQQHVQQRHQGARQCGRFLGRQVQWQIRTGEE